MNCALRVVGGRLIARLAPRVDRTLRPDSASATFRAVRLDIGNLPGSRHAVLSAGGTGLTSEAAGVAGMRSVAPGFSRGYGVLPLFRVRVAGDREETLHALPYRCPSRGAILPPAEAGSQIGDAAEPPAEAGGYGPPAALRRRALVTRIAAAQPTGNRERTTRNAQTTDNARSAGNRVPAKRNQPTTDNAKRN